MSEKEIYTQKKAEKLRLKKDILKISEDLKLPPASIAFAIGKNVQYVRNRIQSDSIDKYYYFDSVDLENLKKFYNLK